MTVLVTWHSKAASANVVLSFAPRPCFLSFSSSSRPSSIVISILPLFFSFIPSHRYPVSVVRIPRELAPLLELRIRWRILVLCLQSRFLNTSPSAEPTIMSSGMLDKSLDDSIASSRQATRRSNRRRASRPTATVGGVKKNTKAAKAAGQGAHQSAPSAPRQTESKIIVSGLVSSVLPRL